MLSPSSISLVLNVIEKRAILFYHISITGAFQYYL